jgi:hypothetical protein
MVRSELPVTRVYSGIVAHGTNQERPWRKKRLTTASSIDFNGINSGGQVLDSCLTTPPPLMPLISILWVRWYFFIGRLLNRQDIDTQ